MRYVDESREVGTKSGRVVTWMRIICDTLADLPAPDAYDGITICIGSRAFVIANKSTHAMQSGGQWVDITPNNGEYTLPPATANSLGGIMVGSGLTVDNAGVLSGDFSALWDAIYQTEKHLTGVPPLSFMASGNDIESAVIYGNGQQQGTPTPDAPIQPTFCGVRTGNLFDKNAKSTVNGFMQDTMLQSDGTTLAWNVFSVSEYIPIESGAEYYISDVMNAAFNAPSMCFYDSSKQFLSSVVYQARNSFGFSIPAGAAYARISYMNTQADAVMLNLGSEALPYEPYGYKIPLTCAGQTVPVYLGQVQTVRKIRKLVLDGTENYSLQSINAYGIANFYFPISSILSVFAICTHLKRQTTLISQTADEGYLVALSGQNASFYMRVDSSRASTVDGLKTYLQQQYANGTPVTVWYVLAEPETGIINEPLCKIGDYADELHSDDAGVTIPTARGQNTLTVDTALQPSKIEITYY